MIPGPCGLLLLASAAGPLHVDPRSVARDADGSPQRPFRTIAAALRAAPSGATLELATGLYSERVIAERPVTLREGKAAVIASPDAGGTVVALQAPATLEHLVIQGGEVGVRATGGARLVDVDFSAQRRASVVASGEVEVRGGKWLALFDRPDLVGLEAEGGTVTVRGTRFDGPFRWAVRGRRAQMVLLDVEIEGAVGGVSLEEGSRGRLVGAVVAQGRQVGVRAQGSTLEILDVVLSRWDHGLEALEGSVVTVEDSAIGFCNDAGITASASRLAVRHGVYVGPARLAAIASIGAQTHVVEGLIVNPGAIGVAFHGGDGSVEGTVIRGARGPTEGDALFAQAARLTIREAFAEECSGNGLTVAAGGVAVAAGLEVYRVQGAGIRVESGAAAHALGVRVQGAGTGMAAEGGSQVLARFCRFRDEAVPSAPSPALTPREY